MNTAIRHLLGAVLVLLGLNAFAGPSCGPSNSPGMERCVVGLPATALSDLHQVQEASNWYWAASVSMLLRRHGVDVSQRAVVRAHLASDDNVPIAIDAFPRLLERRWEGAQGRAVLTSVKPLPAWRLRVGVAAPEVLHELLQERPVLLAAEKQAVLLVQVVYDRPAGGSPSAEEIELVRAVVLDPASPAGLRTLKPAERRPDLIALVHAEVTTGAVPAGVVTAALSGLDTAVAAGPRRSVRFSNIRVLGPPPTLEAAAKSWFSFSGPPATPCRLRTGSISLAN